MPLGESAALGTLLNTRGLVALVVFNIGLDLKIISTTLFFYAGDDGASKYGVDHLADGSVYPARLPDRGSVSGPAALAKSPTGGGGSIVTAA